MSVFSSLKAGAIALVFVATAAQADFIAPALTLDNTTGLALANPPFTMGWRFSAKVPIAVLALGVFDDSGDGLVDSYPTCIFSAAGNPVICTTVDAGTADALVGQFRYRGVKKTLAARIYQIGSLYRTGDDPLVFTSYAINVTTAPQIGFISGEFFSGSALTNPTGSGGPDPGYFGPNFLFTTPEVMPEPLSAALTGAGLVLLLTGRRRRAR